MVLVDGIIVRVISLLVGILSAVATTRETDTSQKVDSNRDKEANLYVHRHLGFFLNYLFSSYILTTSCSSNGSDAEPGVTDAPRELSSLS